MNYFKLVTIYGDLYGTYSDLDSTIDMKGVGEIIIKDASVLDLTYRYSKIECEVHIDYPLKTPIKDFTISKELLQPSSIILPPKFPTVSILKELKIIREKALKA